MDAATGRAIRYDAIPRAVEDVALRLRAFGVENGDVVGLLSRNSPEYLLVVLGILAAGGVVAPVNPSFLPHEIAAQLEGSGVTTLLVAEELAQKAGGIPPVAGLRRVVATGEALDFRALASGTGEPGHPSEPGDALLAWSVGLGGMPAPARHSHDSLSAALVGLSAVAPWREDDVVYSAISPYDLYGLVATLSLSLRIGATAVTAARFEPASCMVAVKRFGATVSNVVPSIVHALVQETPRDGDLAPLRLLISGGAALAPQAAGTCTARLGVPIVQGYGLAEAAGATHLDSDLGDVHPASCGRAIPGIATRVVNSSGSDVVTGEEGELWLKGAQVFRGYRGRPVKTSAAFTSDGWLRTGDLVREDSSKRLTVVGRMKRLLKVKGSQVSPEEIERALRTHSAVESAVALPSWDAESGEETARVCVVARRSVESNELVEWLAARVARHKRPANVEIVPELPGADGPWRLPWA